MRNSYDRPLCLFMRSHHFGGFLTGSHKVQKRGSTSAFRSRRNCYLSRASTHVIRRSISRGNPSRNSGYPHLKGQGATSSYCCAITSSRCSSVRPKQPLTQCAPRSLGPGGTSLHSIPSRSGGPAHCCLRFYS